MSEASLPYAGTSGHSGTDTSRQRAIDADSSGTTARRQQAVLDALREMGNPVFIPEGLTVKELRESTGWHHGVASSVLTNLHIAGKIVRLAKKRDRCHVYVLPEHVDGREVSPYTPNRRNPGSEWMKTRAEELEAARQQGYEKALAAPEYAAHAEYRSDAARTLQRIEEYLTEREDIPSNVAWVARLREIMEEGHRG